MDKGYTEGSSASPGGMTVEEIKDKIKDVDSPYCEVCGGCGCMECCGLERFIEKHIKGKTNCKNEAGFIDDILWLFKEYKK